MADRRSSPLVSIIMGSKSDWPTMEHASTTLDEFGVAHETKIVSAHRTPDLLFEFGTDFGWESAQELDRETVTCLKKYVTVEPNTL